MGLRHPPDPRGPDPRFRLRISRPPDSPDNVFRFPRRRNRGRTLRPHDAWKHLHAHHKPDARGSRGKARSPRRRRGGPPCGLGAGRRVLHVPQPRPGRRRNRRVAVAVRRHVQPPESHPRPSRRRRQIRRESGRPRIVARARQRPHPRPVRREHPQSQGRHPRHRGPLGDRAPERHSAGRRQHDRHALQRQAL